LFAAHITAFSHWATQYLTPFCEQDPPEGFQLCASWRANRKAEQQPLSASKSEAQLPWVMASREYEERSQLILVQIRLSQILESLYKFYSPVEAIRLKRTIEDTDAMIYKASQRVLPADGVLSNEERQQLSKQFSKLGRPLSAMSPKKERRKKFLSWHTEKKNWKIRYGTCLIMPRLVSFLRESLW